MRGPLSYASPPSHPPPPSRQCCGCCSQSGQPAVGQTVDQAHSAGSRHYDGLVAVSVLHAARWLRQGDRHPMYQGGVYGAGPPMYGMYGFDPRVAEAGQPRSRSERETTPIKFTEASAVGCGGWAVLSHRGPRRPRSSAESCMQGWITAFMTHKSCYEQACMCIDAHMASESVRCCCCCRRYRGSCL